MKKRVPLILSIIFLGVFIVFTGMYIYINSSSISFNNIYGNREGLGNFEVVLYKDKDLYEEEMIINSKGIEKKSVINERAYDGVDVLKDKKFFRGIYPSSNTFFENKDVMVNVSIKYDSVIPKLQVRFKNKKENTYESFEVKTEEVIKRSSIDRVSYKDGKINIVFSGSYEGNSIFFGEIPLDSKEFKLVEVLDLGEKLNIDKENYTINLIDKEFGVLENHDSSKVYYKINRLVTDINEGLYIDGNIIEVDSNTREVNFYKPNDKLLDEFKSVYKDSKDGVIGDVFRGYGKIYLTESANNKTSVMVFDENKKDFVFYKDIIENERLERCGVKISDIGTFIIDENRLIIKFMEYDENNKDNKICLAVIDIPSKNPVYIGEIESGYLSSIEILGGK